jgi:drug/metabolite transporter (DMT)-like permease
VSKRNNGNRQGIWAALTSALFLGLAPIFGKQAITGGFSPLAVVALRTGLAAGILFILFAAFKRSYLYIYPAGLLGCMLAGAVNGVGSVLYYLALGKLTVSVGQLLYSLYPVFLVLWLLLDRQPSSRLTYLRILFSLAGVILLTFPGDKSQISFVGIMLMLGAAALYALHLPINQRVLYDIPAPTVTLYTLISMSIVTIPAYMLFDHTLPVAGTPWTPIFLLTIVTLFSRLTLFLGVKHLGGIQTALLGLSELLVAIIIGHIWLGERLALLQWAGAGLLFSSILLIGFEKIKPEKRTGAGGLFGWLRPPEIPPKISWGADK